MIEETRSEFGFPKVIATPDRTDAMLRLCNTENLATCGPSMLVGKELFRTEDGARRMYVDEVHFLPFYLRE